MRRSLRFLAAATAAGLSLTLAACGGSDTPATNSGRHHFAAGTTMAKIQQRGKLIVGVKFDQPLFGLKNPISGEMEGLDIEIAKLLAKDLTGSEQNIQYVESVTANREAFIQQHKVDTVIATYAVTDARKKAVGFAGPYYQTGVAIMDRKSDNSIHSAADLKGKQVCTVNGARAADLIPKAAPGSHIVKFGTYSNCAQALKEHRVDAVITGETILLGIVKQHQNDFKMVDGFLASEEDAIGFTKGDTAFHKYLDQFLTRIEHNGQWTKAYRATIGTVKHTTPTPPKITL